MAPKRPRPGLLVLRGADLVSVDERLALIRERVALGSGAADVGVPSRRLVRFVADLTRLLPGTLLQPHPCLLREQTSRWSLIFEGVEFRWRMIE